MIDGNASLQQLVQQARDEFRNRFGRVPRWITAAPGRVNIIGEHIDYNDGFVLPMAIERYVVLAADRPPAPTPEIPALFQLYSTTTGQMHAWPDAGQPTGVMGHWSSYVWGVLAECYRKGVTSGPLDIVVHSSVPVGGGLSSSAALEVATATLVEAVTGHRFALAEKALLCQKAEHEHAGVPCGIMDQFSAVMGQADHLILLDCRSACVEQVPFPARDISVLITNTNVKHALTGGEYAERRGQCAAAARLLGVKSLRDTNMSQLENCQAVMDPVLVRRARHVLGEIERTTLAAEAFRQANWTRVGELMYASHASLRDDYEVSCRELDVLVDHARRVGETGGVYGSRMTGAGFGGCTVSLVRTEDVESFARACAADFAAQTGIEPTIFVSRPAAGAAVVQ